MVTEQRDVTARKSRNPAELIRAMPIFSAVRYRADLVLEKGSPSGSAAALAKDVRTFCDVIDTLADEVWSG